MYVHGQVQPTHVHTIQDVWIEIAHAHELTPSPFPVLGVSVAQSQWQSGGSQFGEWMYRTPEGQEEVS